MNSGFSLPLRELVETSRRVREAPGRLEKVSHLAELLRRVAPGEIRLAVACLSGDPPQGRLGVGPATLREAWPETAADTSTLSLADVDAALVAIAGASGPGSTAERVRRLGALLERATRDEQAFLGGLVLGELRQGALEGVMVEAVARAADVPAAEVRRAQMLSGELPEVARRALVEGAPALRELGLRLFRPVLPMLAQTADDVADALERLGTAALEYKYDGVRVQVHRRGDEVRVFTRRLNDVTEGVPEIVEAARRLRARELVLDGEAIALRADGRPLPFQVTMGRFGRRDEVARARDELPLRVFFFDLLYLDGESWIDRPLRERLDALHGVVPAPLRTPRHVTDDPAEAEAFCTRALGAGHEGMVAKALDAPYEAGRRGAAWLKVKPALTLDLVVLAAEWGHGRRRGRLSNLHLGARDPETGGFVMLGKTFKGMTDEILEWQTKRLLELETSRDAHTVHVRPALVVEIAFGDLQASSRYPAGLALRFARLKGYRHDKEPQDADTIGTVRAIYERRAGAVST